MSGSTNRAVGIKDRSCEESLNCDSRIKWGLIFFTGKPECKKSVNILVKVYNTLHPLYYLPVISFVYVRLYPNETWLTEFLPSSDEVDKCILWLHFERQQGHLEDWEKVKGKWEKISREPREVTDRLTANIIHLLDWWITPAMSHPHETWQLLTWHTDESYRPWVDVFLLFAFLFRIQHLDHKRGNMKQAFQQTSQNTLYSLSSYF